MSEEEKKATDADSTSEENQEEEKSEEESKDESKDESTGEESKDESKDESEEKASDINYAEELNKLESNETTIETKTSQRSEEEKAKFTVDKIFERFPDLKQEAGTEQNNDESVNTMHRSLLRGQVEGIVRGNSKKKDGTINEDEVKYKMYFYDKRIQPVSYTHLTLPTTPYV